MFNAQKCVIEVVDILSVNLKGRDLKNQRA